MAGPKDEIVATVPSTRPLTAEELKLYGSGFMPVKEISVEQLREMYPPREDLDHDE